MNPFRQLRSLLYRLNQARRWAASPIQALYFITGITDQFLLRHDGVKFYCRPIDSIVLSEFASGEYDFIDCLNDAKDELLVLDLGANIGMFALVAFRGYPKCTVVSIEPSPDTFAVLQKTKSRNPELAWRIRCAAIAEFNGVASFNLAGASPGRRLVRDRLNQPNAAVTQVETVTLSSLVDSECLGRQSVDIVKMDIEGAETSVLIQSATALASIQSIIVEIHDTRDHAPIHEILSAQFPFVYCVGGRKSKKPLVVASRHLLHHPQLTHW